MKIHFKNLWRVFFLGCLFFSTSALLAMKIPDQYKNEAESKLPLRLEPYTKIEIINIFTPVLHKDIQKDFEAYFSIMFDPNFPPPIHGNHVIVGGYRCLYGKCSYALSLGDEEEVKELQRKSLYQLLGFHKNKIAGFFPELAEKIPGFMCTNCAEQAKKDMGLEDGYTQ